MDLPAHALLAYILAKKLGTDPIATTVFGVLPDIIVLPLFIASGRLSLKDLTYFDTEDRTLNRRVVFVNFMIHSIPFSLTLTALFYFLLPSFLLAFLVGYFSHFIADILTHRDEWSLKLFWPFSQKQFPGSFGWYERKHIGRFLIVQYAILISLALIVLL